MAQTWPVTRARRAVLFVIDKIGYALSRPARKRRDRRASASIERILVIEPWNIGDVVLVTPLLAELRRAFPSAAITILAKPHAKDILRATGLVDEVLEADLPWTRPAGKYRLSAADRSALADLARKLRRGRFDLTIDARGDIRNNVLAALTRAPRRIGYDLGGGWMLTDALKTDPSRDHKITDWLRLLEPLGLRAPSWASTCLRVADQELARARRQLSAAGAVRRPIVGYHPGGSHPGKRWPLARFTELSQMILASYGGSIVVFEEPGRGGWSESFPSGSVAVESDLRELMASMKCCDLVVCNDSGPMHLADALEVPVVAIFERGNPQWYGPSGRRARVVKGEEAGSGLTAGPTRAAPRNPIDVGKVFSISAALLCDLGFEPEQH